MIYYLIIFSFIIIFTLVLTLTNFNFINSNKVSKPLSINNNFVMKNKIVDSFSYNGEIKVLKLRLKELYESVDKFVIVEFTTTFSGKQKELTYPLHKHLIEQKYLDKIKYIVYENTGKDNWDREYKQKNSIFYEGLDKLDLKDDDYIIYSDVDEIPNIEDIKIVISNSKDCMRFRSHWFNFTLENYLGEWAPNIWLYKYKNIKLHMNNPRFYFSFIDSIFNTYPNIRFFNCEQYHKTSGWHLSYFFPPEQILDKLKSYSHCNDKKDKQVIDKGVNFIKEKIIEGGELFGVAKRKKFNGNYPTHVDKSYFEI